jgi:hypothetical protein
MNKKRGANSVVAGRGRPRKEHTPSKPVPNLLKLKKEQELRDAAEAAKAAQRQVRLVDAKIFKAEPYLSAANSALAANGRIPIFMHDALFPFIHDAVDAKGEARLLLIQTLLFPQKSEELNIYFEKNGISVQEPREPKTRRIAYRNVVAYYSDLKNALLVHLGQISTPEQAQAVVDGVFSARLHRPKIPSVSANGELNMSERLGLPSSKEDK